MTKSKKSAEHGPQTKKVEINPTASCQPSTKRNSPKVSPKTKKPAFSKDAGHIAELDEVASAQTVAVNAAIATETASTKPKTTKQEQVLTMLAGLRGTTIDEIMKATGWQQHSVRGFFAGTVRKKLGFELTSEKPEGEERRYSIKVAA